jgi:hypothetical protein
VPSDNEISFPKRKLGKKITILVALGDKYPFYSTVKNWVARFRTEHISTEDECLGRPSQVAIPEDVDVMHSIIIDSRRISAKKIAETLTIF